MLGEQRPTNAQIAAMLGLDKAGPGPSLNRPQYSFPTPRFVPTGSLKAAPKSISGSIQATIARGLNKLGVNERRAHQYAARTMAPLTDVTPVGNVTGAEEGWGMLKQGVSKGDLRTGGLGAAILAASVLPYGGKAKKPLKSLLHDTSGAIRAWHGEPIEIGGARYPGLDTASRPIASTEGGAHEFWRWMNERGSKAIDAEGRPIALYHATQSAPFDKFKNSWRGATYVTFGPNRALRGAYGGLADRIGETATKMSDLGPMRVMDVYARVPSVSALNPPRSIQEKLAQFPSELTDDEIMGPIGDAIEGAGLLPHYQSHFVGPYSRENHRMRRIPDKGMLDILRDQTPYDGGILPGYITEGERDHVARMIEKGFDGSLVSDEAGVSLSVFDPENLWVRR